METTKILIIEDNIVTLGDIEMRLAQMGYPNTETAVSGLEAIEIAQTFEPNLILSDINLGKGITGIEAVGQIKQILDVPVVYLTAYDDDNTLREAGVTEPYAYLLKPLQERELQIALKIALHKHQLESQLKEAIAIKDQFISILAHDLRSPFNTLLGFSEILLNNFEKYDPQKTKQYLSNINKSAKQTFNLLNNLLEWSRSQRNKIKYTPQTIDLHYLFRDVYYLLHNTAEAKKIQMQFDVREQTLATADNDMLQTVIRNLVSNAIKYTPENGTITASAYQNDEYLKIKITDTGIGMDKETLDSLFKIGKTKSMAGTNGEQGTGFGLLLCKEFIDKHNGTISVQSELGKGSSFTITLPPKA